MTIQYQFGPFELDVEERRLAHRGEPVHLEPKAFDVLSQLLESAGHLVQKETLLACVWPNVVVTQNSLARSVHQLRVALGDDSDAPSYIETVPGAGYRFIAPVEKHDNLTALGDGDNVRDTGTWMRGATMGLMMVLIVGAAGWFALRDKPVPAPEVHRLAVLPLANLTGDPDQAYFVHGVHEALISELSRIQSVDVISRTSVMRYANANLGVPQIARELNVDALVEGSVLRDGDRLSVIAQLITVAPERHLWTNRYDRTVGNLFDMTANIASAIAEVIAPDTLPLESVMPAHRAPIPEAYDAYLQGRFKFLTKTREDYEQALQLFERAIELDPRFAPAYTGLAHTLGSAAIFGMRPPGESMPRVRELANKALRIDAANEDAHLLLAGVSFYWEWDWTEAERRLRRVLELNPNSASAWRMLSEVLSVTGRHEAALSAIEKGRSLDPMAPNSQLKPALIHYLRGDYTVAAASARAAVVHFDDYWVGHWMLCHSLTALGHYDDAIEACEQAVSRSDRAPLALATLGYVLARAGQTDKAEELLESLEALRERQYVGSACLAVIHGALGQDDEAFNDLERAYEERDIKLIHADNAADFDSLREDPRFLTLRTRVPGRPSS